MERTQLAVGVAAVLIFVAGCTPRVCDPGETQLCHCPGSLRSAQVCDADGALWQPCPCDVATADPDTPPLEPQGEPAALSVGDAVTCADPEPAGPLLSFTDRTDEAGIGFTPSTPVVEPGMPPEGVASLDIELGGGQVTADLDGDGHLDLVFADSDGVPRFFRGDGDLGFSEVPGEQIGLPTGDHWLHGVAAVDVDGDWDQDLYFLARDDNLMLENQGDGTFVDVTDATGLAGGGQRSAGAAWVDFDRDGDLDTYVANHGAGSYHHGDYYDADRDHFFVQGDDGSFEDRMDDLFPYEQDGYGFQAAWFDADSDGWQDLYVVNDMASKGLYVPNIYVENEGPGDDAWSWSFREDSGLIIPMLAMGVAIGDMDNDMDFDVHVTQAGPTLLARNDRFDDETFFTDLSLVVMELGFTDAADISYSTSWFDHDNDGWQELHTTFSNMPTKGDGYGPSDTANAADMPDGFWLWDPQTQTYGDIAPQLGIDDEGLNHTAVVSDLNRDGFLDFVLVGIYGGPKLFVSGCNDNAWLLVHLEMPGTKNVHAIGAEVELWAGGEPRQLRQVVAGLAGNFSGGPPEVHFGAHDLDEVDLVVRWPDGSRTVNRGVPTRREVWLTR